MNLNKTRNIQLLAGCICLSMAACSDDVPSTGGGQTGAVDDVSYIGKAVGNFSADEWYPGGELGTTLNVSEGCYEDETPATTNMGLTDQFNRGEMFFERNVTMTRHPSTGSARPRCASRALTATRATATESGKTPTRPASAMATCS